MREKSPLTGRTYRKKLDGTLDGRSRQCQDGACSCGYTGTVVTSRKYAGTYCRPCYTKIIHADYVENKGYAAYREMLNVYARANRSMLRECERRYREKLKETNPKKLAAKSTAFKRLLRERRPKWLTSEQIQEITRFYENRPAGCHVDHIIPLRGKGVCGLHVLENLQYLPATENLKKGNKY